MSNTKERPPRVGGIKWQRTRGDNTIAVYNCNYSPSGRRIAHQPKPWIVTGRLTFETFPTHAEAIDYAFKEACK